MTIRTLLLLLALASVARAQGTQADYDRSERFKRSDVLILISGARNSVAKFSELPMSDDKRFFLACLWAWKELTNR